MDYFPAINLLHILVFQLFLQVGKIFTVTAIHVYLFSTTAMTDILSFPLLVIIGGHNHFSDH